jgi:choline dehydrogenase-like flavoprotein
MVYKVLTDDRHRARGVLLIDRSTREPREIEARVVVLCAQALESARILLNSADERQPNGLANSSGVLGHYLMDHTSGPGGARGEFPDLPVGPFADGPQRPTGIYVVRFRNTTSGPRYPKFLRGYGFQGGATTSFDLGAPGFGRALKNAVRAPRTSFVFWGYGECLARFENRVEIDRGLADAWGIPVLRIHMSWGENERAMFPDMAETAAEMLEAAGAKNVAPYIQAGNDGADGSPGWAIHETGTARMGTDAKRSVLNAFQQSHDVPNLFVMDGSGFVSSACQNPTLTIMALAVRSTDYLLEEMRKGTL